MGKTREPSRAFRGALFGFRKTDVLNYVDWADHEHQEAVTALCGERDALKQQLHEATAQLTVKTEEAAQSKLENEQLTKLCADQTERIGFLDASCSAYARHLSETQENLHETNVAMEAQRVELAECRLTLEAESKACLELLGEMQETADEMRSLGHDRLESATGQSIACLTGMEEAMETLLERIVAMRNGISDVRVLMENGTDGTTEAFAARLSAMQERMESLRNDAAARLEAKPDAGQPEPVPAPAKEEPRPQKPHPARPAGSVRSESTDMRGRLLRLLEGFLGRD